MRVGITGTQRGATEAQLTQLRETLIRFGVTEIHHGDCIGVDSEAHDVARALGIRIVIHPPLVETKCGWNEGDDRREPKPYLERNHDIVDETLMLIAVPGEDKEQLRSGTWSTVRYARRLGRPVQVITPGSA